MASLQTITGPRGTRFKVQFYDREGVRRSVGLGRMNERRASEIHRRIESLIEIREIGEHIDPTTAAWLRSVAPSLRRRLEKAQLIDAPPMSSRLGDFLKAYVDGRSDVKSSTKLVLGHTRRCLIEYFGADRRIESITRGDMDDWRQWLVRAKPKKESKGSKKPDGQGLAENTARRRGGIARQYFSAAMRRKLITENPADHLTVTVRGSVKKRFFVTPEISAKVLDACPDLQWRLLFVLARWGGLRMPSEALGLRWSDVLWDSGRLRIRSSKTEHHEGGEERLIPIFPEIEAELRTAFELATPGEDRLITRYVGAETNLRTQFAKIIRRAGLTPWPKLFVNLRATRSTELFSAYPRHVAEAWMGHGMDVATEHYLSVSEDHFKTACAKPETVKGANGVLRCSPIQSESHEADDEIRVFDTVERALDDRGQHWTPEKNEDWARPDSNWGGAPLLSTTTILSSNLKLQPIPRMHQSEAAVKRCENGATMQSNPCQCAYPELAALNGRWEFLSPEKRRVILAVAGLDNNS